MPVRGAVVWCAVLAWAAGAAAATPGKFTIAKGTVAYQNEETECYVLREGRGVSYVSANELAEAMGGRLAEGKRNRNRYDLLIPARGKPKVVVRFHRGRKTMMLNWVLHYTKYAPVVRYENVYISVPFAKLLCQRALKETATFDAKSSRFAIGPQTSLRALPAPTTPPAIVAVSAKRPRQGVLTGLSDWWQERLASLHSGAWKDGGRLSVIALDAGHGGHDGGAPGPTGFNEKEATLAIVLRLRDLLKERMPGVKTVLTRSDDRFIPLPDRARIANQAHADLFLSVHMNSSPSRHAHGTEVYRYSPKSLGSDLEKFENQGASDDPGSGLNLVLTGLEESTKDRYSVELGGLVKQSLVEASGYDLEDRHDTILGGRFYVLAHAKMPAILAEVAFISNRREEKLLKTSEFQSDAAGALCRALEAYRLAMEGNAPYLAPPVQAESVPVSLESRPESVSTAAEVKLPGEKG